MENTNAYQSIVEGLHDGLYLVDRNRVITFWNKAAERISGFPAEEVVGRSCSDNVLTHVDASGRQLCHGTCPLAATMEDCQNREAEVYLHHKNGHRIPVSVRVSPLTDDSGSTVGGIELFTDLSNHQANALRVRELEKLALLDELTQLGNRRCIEGELQSRLEESSRMDMPFGVLFMDIDHFKHVNDVYGHDVGDDVLKFVARTLVANARPFDFYGRWGGEEFICILRNVSPQELEQIGERLRRLIENAYLMLDGKRLGVTISVGATMVRKGDDISALIKRVDGLLYQSKEQGRNLVSVG